MLAYILALAVGFGSFTLYMVAFFLPEVHRKSDFIWSGVGLFYALILWVCAGRITGAVLLGQMASVGLLGWFGWQTLTLRRSLAPASQQTPIPALESIPGPAVKGVSGGGLSQLSGQVTGLFAKKKAAPVTQPSSQSEATSSPPDAAPATNVAAFSSEVNEAWAEEQAIADREEAQVQPNTPSTEKAGVARKPEATNPTAFVSAPSPSLEKVKAGETPTVEVEVNHEVAAPPAALSQLEDDVWEEETSVAAVPEPPKPPAAAPAAKTAKQPGGFGSLFSNLKNRLGLSGMGKRKSKQPSPAAQSPKTSTPASTDIDRILQSELATVAEEVAAEATAEGTQVVNTETHEPPSPAVTTLTEKAAPSITDDGDSQPALTANRTEAIDTVEVKAPNPAIAIPAESAESGEPTVERVTAENVGVEIISTDNVAVEPVVDAETKTASLEDSKGKD